ncbi:tRNA (adenosine(37)-N6)-dimethylallyltransferase MiaA [Helicobacter sp. 12S02634-8]|uniref:tRNA (adenosine(37)-N6)-dimethylallyltransferase MiaA n=1 Tax=Helicobacter sp. 12S02634-8 TaxID=1476199 RepID=UPI000BA694BC|nr:tRNA (adenosine(37)-N6)-dimethylallyltransferase MiaA [Helicobacter sp. 12S02634-8]PAF46438.1 tRNA (adenosine(37)-N6)-dimethylallyltransferase MiaA [Helicobacter sp. 12S02634-8]
MDPKKEIRLIAILGATASGKSALALEIAELLDAAIFSLDSLSIYRGIDIASAKPKISDRVRIKHYGIDMLDVPELSNAAVFKHLLQQAIKDTDKKTLLIVGGSSFYLKSIIEGLSVMPLLSPEEKQALQKHIQAQKAPYELLSCIDPLYASTIKPTDTYRTHKGLEIYFSTNTPPSLYFKQHPKIPFEYAIELFGLKVPKEELQANIKARTQQMIKDGIIEEIAALIQKYPKDSQPFKAIGPKECIAYLERPSSIDELQTQISLHTTQLAKRQTTFNKTQFQQIHTQSKEEILSTLTRT